MKKVKTLAWLADGKGEGSFANDEEVKSVAFFQSFFYAAEHFSSRTESIKLFIEGQAFSRM
jgi:hypothetical protein